RSSCACIGRSSPAQTNRRSTTESRSGAASREERNFSATAHGIADVNRVRGGKVFQVQCFFRSRRLGFEQMPPISPRQQSASNRRRKPLAVLLDEHVTDGAFGDLAAFIQEKHLLIASPEGLFILPVVKLAAGRLMAQEPVARGHSNGGNHNLPH